MARNFMCTKTDPVVETKAGKLRGFQLDGTYVFHGVKYADAKRFHQPTPVEPWEGIKNALAYGYVCPMLQQDQPSNELMVRTAIGRSMRTASTSISGRSILTRTPKSPCSFGCTAADSRRAPPLSTSPTRAKT